MPRSIDVILRGDIVDIVQLMKPGERQTSSNVDTNRM